MAADSRVNLGDSSYTTQKIWRIGDAVVGAAGASYYVMQFLEMIRDGEMRQFVRLPEDQDSETLEFEGMVLREEGIYVVDVTLTTDLIKDKYYAIGSGAGPARAAMMMKASPTTAVKVAAQIDRGTGLPIKSIRLRRKVQCHSRTKK